jgi:hypothetical protein
MPEQKRPFKVFCSWQSDLRNQVNSQLSRSGLRDVERRSNEDDRLDFHVIVDDCAEKVPGSPSIATTMFNKT